ncbi:MAG: hypothetical protein ACK5TH_12510 [Prosthecobacter sp.]
MKLDILRPVRFHFGMRLFLLLCLLLPLTGCGLLKKKQPPPPKDNRTGQARVIGVIEMVNPEQNYVLINCDTRPTLEAGVELIALDSNGQKSKLVVTPERKGNYLTADIKEGTPSVGCLALQKIRESDKLPAPPSAAPAVDGATLPASAAPSFDMPTERPPPIPEIQFPSKPAPASSGDLPLPAPLEPSTLPPVIR